MKRISILITALAVALCLGTPIAFGQGRGQSGGRPNGPGAEPGAGGQGNGGEMGRSGSMAGTRGNGSMDNQNMRNQPVSHSSPTSLLSSNTKLASTLQERIGSMLPAGTSLTDAASGFKNLGDFVAAVHVSHNLGIPFNDLKDKMTSGDSLGKAIKELKPDANIKAEAKKSKNQAKEDMKDLNS